MTIYYIWSNIDGNISVYNNWDSLNEDSCIWEYLNYHEDSLDFAEVGFVVDRKRLEESEGRALCILKPLSETFMDWSMDKKKANKMIERINDFPEHNISKHFLGIPLLICSAFQCEEETMDLGLEELNDCTCLLGIETIKMNHIDKLIRTGWDWLLKTHNYDNICHLYIDKYGKDDIEATSFLPILRIKESLAVIINGRIHEESCDIYYNKGGNSFVLLKQYNKIYGY